MRHLNALQFFVVVVIAAAVAAGAFLSDRDNIICAVRARACVTLHA